MGTVVTDRATEKMMQELTLEALRQVCQDLNAVAARIRRDTQEVLLTTDPIEVVKHYDQLRQANAQIKTAREALQEMDDDLSREQIPTLFTNRSVKTMNIEDVGRVTVSYRYSASMLDKDKGMKWLDDNGHGGLITATVNSSSLAAFAKEMLEAGTELPDDLFKVSTSPYTSITKR